MNKIVSVIIPTFNRAQSLKRAIDSVFAQSYKSWEILVIDNSSSDGTELILRQYNKDKVKILSVKNDGVIGYSRNIGIQNAKGEIIAFLDSDDWWEPLKLEKCVEYLTSNKDVKIFYPSNKYSIVIKDPDNNVKPTLDAYELAVTHSMVQSTNYSHNKYKNLSWAMQNL